MSYLSQDELVIKFGQEEVDQATLGLEPEDATAKVAAAINSAEAVVNSHLGARGYSLPVDATALVKDTVADIARYKLFDNRASQQIRENYEDAIKFLEKIVAGKAELTGASEDVPQEFAPTGGNARVGETTTGMDWSGY